MDEQIRHRFAVLTWATGITAGLVIALLATTINLSFQVGVVTGQLSIIVEKLK